ncbi:fructosyl amino acid oxidase [Aspergillus insuetus]
MSSTGDQEKTRVTIVGAGLFGLTTALELTKRGYNVLVLDRDLAPVRDGSSVDISRVIRPDYADKFYAQMGLEAMKGWEGEFSSFFHRSGLLCVAQGNSHAYLESSRQNLDRMGIRVETRAGSALRDYCPAIQGDLADTAGYFNPICGWADAQGSLQYLARQCIDAGVSFLSGASGTVVSLVQDGTRVVGVKTRAGSVLRADLVVLATGAWTPHLVEMDNLAISTSQPVGFIQLTNEEAGQLKDCPVIINLSTGWFVFPPTPGTNMLKMARHGYGYETCRLASGTKRPISAPLLSFGNTNPDFLPVDAEAALRDGLASFFPQFADKRFCNRRLCWYSDTRQGDFVVDFHPSFQNLFVSTGDSGHAFKFLPILGRYIVDNLEGKADPDQKAKWAWKQSSIPITRGDGSRGGPPRRLLKKDEQARL